jgi:hypothetical protein
VVTIGKLSVLTVVTIGKLRVLSVVTIEKPRVLSVGTIEKLRVLFVLYCMYFYSAKFLLYTDSKALHPS